jgi:hypothetical protein
VNWLTPVSTTGVVLMVVRWWRRRRHERAVDQALGDANPVEPTAGAAGQLSPGLSRVAAQAYTLRLVLEAPVRRIRAPLLSESPWRRRERCDEYDNVLGEVRRAMWDWLREVEHLAETDRRVLRELGLTLGPFRSFLFHRIDRTNDSWEQVVWAEAPDVQLVYREVMRTIMELRRFETTLVQAANDPYRAAG